MTQPRPIKDNPVVALDMHTKDGATLRFKLPEISQLDFMSAIGKMLAELDVPLDVELPDQEQEPKR